MRITIFIIIAALATGFLSAKWYSSIGQNEAKDLLKDKKDSLSRRVYYLKNKISKIQREIQVEREDTLLNTSEEISKLKRQMDLSNKYLEKILDGSPSKGQFEIVLKEVEGFSDRNPTKYHFTKVFKDILIIDTKQKRPFAILIRSSDGTMQKMDSLDLIKFDNRVLDIYNYEGYCRIRFFRGIGLPSGRWHLGTFHTDELGDIGLPGNLIFDGFGDDNTSYISVWKNIGNGLVSFKGIVNVLHNGDYMTGMNIVRSYGPLSDGSYIIHGIIAGGDGGDIWGTDWLARMNDRFELDVFFRADYEGRDWEGFYDYESKFDSLTERVVMTNRLRRYYSENGKDKSVDSLIWTKVFDSNDWATKKETHLPDIE